MGKLSRLRNIGTTLERRLNEIGVYDREGLQRIGAAQAYRRLAARSPRKHLPVCYNLYALQGALQDRHWAELSDAEKQALLDAVDDRVRGRSRVTTRRRISGRKRPKAVSGD